MRRTALRARVGPGPSLAPGPAWPPGWGTVRTYDRGMSSDAVPEAVVPVQLDPQLDGQLSINDILLELGQAPVVHPSPDAASELHFF